VQCKKQSPRGEPIRYRYDDLGEQVTVTRGPIKNMSEGNGNVSVRLSSSSVSSRGVQAKRKVLGQKILESVGCQHIHVQQRLGTMGAEPEVSVLIEKGG